MDPYTSSTYVWSCSSLIAKQNVVDAREAVFFLFHLGEFRWKLVALTYAMLITFSECT